MKIKNLEEALICFKENAIIHGECTQNGDNKRGNKSHKNIIGDYIRQYPDTLVAKSFTNFNFADFILVNQRITIP